jgi:phosphopantothenoylcysteine decarboxylase/phosphopantothenate--cysteine ligase
MLTGREILLGVSGGIAAYKAAELLRLLRKAGAGVTVSMTRAATRFVAPLTFQTLSGRKVLLDLFDDPGAGRSPFAPEEETEGAVVDHIDLVRRADLAVVAPATANLLGKVASGIGDDALTTLLLASGTRVLFAPAMNHRMWDHPSVRANVAALRERGFRFVEPGAGYQACGETGVGRMAEPGEIFERVVALVAHARSLAGLRVLVTAGRTEEPLDPVRFLSNRSSGRMGIAVAEVARDRGADVVLVAGPTSAPLPGGIETVRVRTAAEMGEAVRRTGPGRDVIVMVAAVSDWRPADPAPGKMKRAEGERTIRLEPTADILAGLGREKGGRILVGFALETGDGRANARRKLLEKNLDLVVLNDPGVPGAGFEVETNVVTILRADGSERDLPLRSKRAVAEALWDEIAALSSKPRPAATPAVAGKARGRV